MGVKDGSEGTDFNLNTQNNLRSLGMASDISMRLIAVKNACHYSDGLSLLLELLMNEKSDKVLLQIERSFIEALGQQNNTTSIRQSIIENLEEGNPSVAQRKVLQSILKQL